MCGNVGLFCIFLIGFAYSLCDFNIIYLKYNLTYTRNNRFLNISVMFIDLLRKIISPTEL